ncbi:hypothetical protein MMC29_007815 [Sticta canariensis]|nr:hypothetical protein [Sticta canariensis]
MDCLDFKLHLITLAFFVILIKLIAATLTRPHSDVESDWRRRTWKIQWDRGQRRMIASDQLALPVAASGGAHAVERPQRASRQRGPRPRAKPQAGQDFRIETDDADSETETIIVDSPEEREVEATDEKDQEIAEEKSDGGSEDEEMAGVA